MISPDNCPAKNQFNLDGYIQTNPRNKCDSIVDWDHVRQRKLMSFGQLLYKLIRKNINIEKN